MNLTSVVARARSAKNVVWRVERATQRPKRVQRPSEARESSAPRPKAGISDAAHTACGDRRFRTAGVRMAFLSPVGSRTTPIDRTSTARRAQNASKRSRNIGTAPRDRPGTPPVDSTLRRVADWDERLQRLVGQLECYSWAFPRRPSSTTTQLTGTRLFRAPSNGTPNPAHPP